MAVERTPIDVAEMSEAAQKAVAGPMKLMAARGMAPLRPGDLITVLYQLSLDSDLQIKQAAKKSAAGLPDKVLTGAVADTSVDPRVLDYFAPLIRAKADLVQLLLLNTATADHTVAVIAKTANEAQVQLISGNEQRLLRHPEIIAAIYVNAKARMSTVDRTVELAVRNDVKVPGIAAWDEIKAAVIGVAKKAAVEDVAEATKMDQLFASAAKVMSEPGDATDEPEAPAEEEADIPISEMSIPMKIRLATLGNAFTRAVLIRDSIRMVAMATVKAPGVKDAEISKWAGNHSMSDDVIAYIAQRREWTKSYSVKRALVTNPKTPIPAAIRFMPHLRERDLRQISKSKGVPSAVSANAKKLLMARSGGGGRRS